jgi:N-acetylmuramoyl-L-alanine amidase
MLRVKIIWLFLLFTITGFCDVSWVKEQFTIVLDSGHTPKQQGALGVQGIYEVKYNDNLTAQLAQALRQAGFSVILTPTQDITLEERTQIANKSNADLFLAIHHDSAQLKYLEKSTSNSLVSYHTTTPISGYSIFVSTLNAHFDNSIQFATLLGKNILKLGRVPATHHAENIQGENRKWLNEALGIYQFDDLIVLKKTTVPAVLLEVGVIVDKEDEAYISNPEKQGAIVQSIVSAVQAYKTIH